MKTVIGILGSAICLLTLIFGLQVMADMNGNNDVDNHDQSSIIIDYGAGLDCVEDTDCLRAAIRSLREKMGENLSKVIRQCCDDSIAFYLSMLNDTSFYGHYGDYGQPAKWFFAVERLGQIGGEAIPGLIAKLESDDAVERVMALQAFSLAVQEASVKKICGKDIPVHFENWNMMSQAEKIEAAESWYVKYRKRLNP